MQSYTWIVDESAWARGPVTQAEHEYACMRAENWLDDHEGEELSISVRAPGPDQVSGIYPDGTGAALAWSAVPDDVFSLIYQAYLFVRGNWPAPLPAPIETTLGALADEYGVNIEEHGFPGADREQLVVLSRDEHGWHVGGPLAPHMTDDGWAPRDDEHAEQIRQALGEEVA